VKFEIVALGIEQVNGIAAVALDAAMKFAKLLDGFERVAVIFLIHVERLMGDAVLVERISVERSGTLEEDDVVVAASQPVQSLDVAMDRQRVRIVGIAADAAQVLHAQHVGIEVARAFQVIHRDAHVIDLL